MDPAMLAAAEARSSCKGEPNLIERIKKAMRACHNHWMVTDEKDQFRAAIAAAMLESEGEDRDRIERTAKAMNRVGAMIQAKAAAKPLPAAPAR
jgi:hypothetical protein